MLVGAHDRGVNDQVFEIGTFYQRVEHAFPNALLGPPAEALENAVPIAECWRQIAPWRTRARDPEHRIDEQTIVLAMSSLIALFPRNKVLDPSPLLVRQFSPNQDRPPQLRY